VVCSRIVEDVWTVCRFGRPEGSSIDGGHVSRIVLLRGAGSPGACMSSGDLCEIVGWRWRTIERRRTFSLPV